MFEVVVDSTSDDAMHLLCSASCTADVMFEVAPTAHDRFGIKVEYSNGVCETWLPEVVAHERHHYSSHAHNNGVCVPVFNEPSALSCKIFIFGVLGVVLTRIYKHDTRNLSSRNYFTTSGSIHNSLVTLPYSSTHALALVSNIVFGDNIPATATVLMFTGSRFVARFAADSFAGCMAWSAADVLQLYIVGSEVPTSGQVRVSFGCRNTQVLESSVSDGVVSDLMAPD